MACADIPLDIFNQHRPPEAQKELGTDGEDTLVPEVVVHFLYNEPSNRKKRHAELMNDAYSASERPTGQTWVSRKSQICANLASLPATFPDFGIIG
ncbi:hypothetical protein PAXRUDRAFT_21700 [Paxillus rubicundulus Ve08.2h10]|uniref:Uncharacterized protein n=1 Tax=Paxillus rubicundulus Ve08.2h10 TaxID=930991 RepID=A0A0D0BLX0_9AGAM|nr:hypothetical protein PAXRUDRAFT_21700 [Paxillus rubicundulus Ve08.2h10]